MDVTSIVKPIIDGGAGGIYNFSLTETSSSQEGEALVVVYTNPALATGTFGILDGFARTSGDTTAINFADPLGPHRAGLFRRNVSRRRVQSAAARCLPSR